MIRAATVALAALAAFAIPACGDDDSGEQTSAPESTTGAGTEVVFPGNCTSGFSQEPPSVVVTCADSGITVANIQWQAWGAETAEGNGTAHVNDCDPDCVAGEIKAYDAAQLTLSAIEDCGSTSQYTRLELSFEGKAPPGSSNPLRERFPCP